MRTATAQRVPAPAIEAVVGEACDRLLPGDGMARLKAVHMQDRSLRILLARTTLRAIEPLLHEGEDAMREGADCIVTVPLTLPMRGGRHSVRHGRADNISPDDVLIAALRKARAMLTRDARGLPTLTTGPVSNYERNVLRLGMLAPDIQQAILAGRQPASLNLEQLIHGGIPLAWSEQRQMLGFPARG